MENDEVTMETVHKAFKVLKDEVQAGSLSKDKKEKLEVVFKAYDEQANKTAIAEQIAKSQAEEVKELKEHIEASSATQQEARDSISQLEIALANMDSNSNERNYKENDDYKAFNHYSKTGIVEEALNTLVGNLGGYLVPTQLDTELTKNMVEIDGIRAISRTRTIVSNKIDLPRRTSIPIATFEAETAVGTNSQSAYGKQTLTPQRQTFSTSVTYDMLKDSSFDIEAEMSSDAALAFANGEGIAFVQGTGIAPNPAGFMQDPNVLLNVRTTGLAAALSYDGIVRLPGDLEDGFDPVFTMNRSTLADIRALTDANGRPIWAPGLDGGTSPTLAGFPIILAPSMPNVAAAAFPIAFGDFRRGYTIVDNQGTLVIRDELTLKKAGEVEFTWNRWTTGAVVLSQAIRVLKVSL